MTTSATPNSTPNHLLGQTSPYLKQHAHNPVDWHPWGEEAFELARERGVPVFLSIGYATCHWCHVMAHESFEDPAVAELMNAHFVSIKADREERPDIDAVYMTACHLFTGSGGWPLNLLVTPDRDPFFAATYIPREARMGRYGMLELVPRLGGLWKDNQAQVRDTVAQVRRALAGEARPPLADNAPLPGPKVLERAVAELDERFDREHGGFGDAPKFPSPHLLLFLLHRHRRTGDAKALDMARATLAHMRRGGIHDLLGGGFHRYSTDRIWLLPHFEKMLYDQAGLALAYTEAWRATRDEAAGLPGGGEGDPHGFRATAEDIIGYVLRDLGAEIDGAPAGFYSAEDADSEGEEGTFYVFGLDEVRDLLSPEDATLATAAFGMRRKGNYLDEATKEFTGKNILYPATATAELAAIVKQDEPGVDSRLADIRSALYAHRAKRPRPLRDEKILADWNGYFIAALARAGRIMERPDWVERAAQAARFVDDQMRDADGNLLHAWCEGQASVPGLLDDHAFLCWGHWELFRATRDEDHAERALELADIIRSRFLDPAGGFFLTPEGGEQLPVRPKEPTDAAMPSGHSVAAYLLLRLARFTDRADLEKDGLDAIRSQAELLRQAPTAYGFLLRALNRHLLTNDAG